MKRARLSAAALLVVAASRCNLSPVAAPVAPTPPLSNEMAGGRPVSPRRACHHAIPATCVEPPPAYHDVLPILESRCFGCHAGAGIAADVYDFSVVGALARAGTQISDEISECAMPPRSPLDDEDATTLLRWVVCGQKMN